MIRILLKLIFASALLIVIVLLINTFRAPSSIPVYPSSYNEDTSTIAAKHLSEAIQLKTVSFGDTLPIDTNEFRSLISYLQKTYPFCYAKLQLKTFNEFSQLFIWKGRDTTLAPYVLMAHTDVVPVESATENKWKVSPFSGAIVNDTIWGRGAADDKVAVIAILESVEKLLAENYQPERTIYLSFGHDEEVSGRRGAKLISNWFIEHKINPALVIDEGGQIDNTHFKELARPVAVIATGEKGYVNIELNVEIPGGHSSMPNKETAIDVLTNAIAKVRANPMPAMFTPSIDELLGRTKDGEGFVKRMALNNLWLFRSMLISQLEKTKETNAMIHTTIVPTIVKAGIKDNVIPSSAKATLNSRILPGQSSDDVVNYVKKIINDERVVVTKQTISLMEPSATTPTSAAAFKIVEGIVYKTVPNVIVSPFLMLGASDSRYFRSFSEAVLNFSAVQDVKGFHNINERIGIADLNRMIFFYKSLITDK